MRKAAGIGLVAIGLALGSTCILVGRLPLQSAFMRWLIAFSELLQYLHVGFDVAVFSLCAGGALLAGFLLLTSHQNRAVEVGWQSVRFLLHLAAIYAIAAFGTLQLAAWTKNTLLPFLQHPTSSSSFQFLFSHLFAFSFIPAFLIGLANARFKHTVAQYAWFVPAVVLA